jgi:membrane-associated phospholipid phosphatase
MRWGLLLLLVVAEPAAADDGEPGLFTAILQDQADIWTSPAHIRGHDLPWLVPFAGATAALIATDASTAARVSSDPHSIQVSDDVSQGGAEYTVFGVSGLLFLSGALFHDDHAKSAGLHATEALADAAIVVEVLKLSTGRDRPLEGDHQGAFFQGKQSFPSGHSIEAWALASVIAGEYDHPLVKVGAFSYATAVAVSRFTGRHHFASDILVGSTLGYLIGHHVEAKRNPHPPGKAKIAVVPTFGPRAFGVALEGEFSPKR